MITSVLRANPNLKKLAPLKEEQLRSLARTAWLEHGDSGRHLMREGDLSNQKFFIVASGSFEIVAHEPFEVVTHDGLSYLSRPEQPHKATDGWAKRDQVKTVRQVGPKTCFGDSSMLYGAPRWATMTALEGSSVWVISQANFKVAQMQATESAPAGKTAKDEDLIAEALRANLNLQRLTTMGSTHIKDLVGVAWKEVLVEGQVLMREGDLNADALYIVGDGSLEFSGSEPFEVVSSGEVSYLSRAAHCGEQLKQPASGQTVRQLGRGLCFGEISMVYCAPRFATVRALKETVLWAIDRSNFQMVQMKAAEDDVRERVRHLDLLEVMQTFAREDKEKVAAVMETMRLEKGEILAKEGEVGSALFLLYQGAVKTSCKGKQIASLEADPSEGLVHFFGESALAKKEPFEETVEVTSDFATALVLEREEFTKVWDRLVEQTTSPTFQRYTTSASKVGGMQKGLTLESLDKIGLLGVGGLGPVELRRHRVTKDLYALKTMSKGLIVQRGFRKSIIKEKTLCTEVISPFIVRHFAQFRDDQSVSFLSEAALGGELASVMPTQGFHGSSRHAMYYVAGAVLALEHLHKRKILFRNIKPGNLLLSQQGRPKLSDFSLAKRVLGHTFTTCGTPSYMAPEIVAGTGHSRAADWWSMGILTYWLMSGQTPFESEHPMEIYSKVMQGIARVQFPASCGGAVADLVKSLLRPIAIDRLAMRQGGIRNVMEHQWFADFSWTAMRNQVMDPPYVPEFKTSPVTWKDTEELDGASCLAHFSARAEDLPQPVQYCDDGSGWDLGIPLL